MSKNYSKKRRLKYVFMAFACTAAFSVSGLAAGCTDNNEEETEKTTSVEDAQLLKNGNFEFFTVPEKEKDGNEPVYLINTPDNWSSGGTSPYTMSGIIGTSDTAWDKITSPDLANTLDYINALDSSASNYKQEYVDYNGMKASDLLYKDTYAALNFKEDEDNEEGTTDPRTEFIKNPETHYGVQKKSDGSYYYVDGDGKEQTVYVDDKGDYYLEYSADKDEYSKPVSHVLMLHNYSSSTHNGITQNYTSVSVDLPANTAAEISVWVKTSDLFYDRGQAVEQDAGAYITVNHSVGGTSLDEFTISCINTEKLIEENKTAGSNGWVEYTVYVNSCNFASSSISIELGLGEADSPVEGYAFFDDVTVTKYSSLTDENCSYSANKSKIDDAVCTIESEANEKIFIADSVERNGALGDNKYSDSRFSDNFYYLLDLASVNDYKKVDFIDAHTPSITIGLTVDEDNYVSSSVSKLGANVKGGMNVSQPTGNEKLPTELKDVTLNGVSNIGIDTSGDLLALVKASYKFTASDTAYSTKLNEALKDADSLPNSNADSNVLVMLSEKGAAYTASFDLEVEHGGYQIVSFWVKTSDMNGNTAATLRLTEKNNKDNSSNFVIDTTGIVTDIDDNEDIYNGWVQCFFFVHNELENDSSYTVEFSFGNTTIKDTSVTSYKAGWVALANMQILSVEEQTYSYVSSESYTASLILAEDEVKTPQVFDDAYGAQEHQIKDTYVSPSNYDGVNGGSSAVTLGKDENVVAGLINKDYAGNYAETDWYKTLIESFNYSPLDATKNWNDVFGDKSVQPLIIVNTIKDGYVKYQSATEDTFKDYFIKDEDGNFKAVKDLDNPEFDKDTTYYSLKQVINYGFVGNSATVSADSYATVSVRVKASKGAVAYVYLVEANGGKVLSFSTPSYSFYYDADGNVLKAKADDEATTAEKRANILYTLRDDGLYEDANGNLYANIWNYTKVYKDETADYYNENGEAVSFEDIVNGENYYKTSAGALSKDSGDLVNHFLQTTGGVNVYEYIDGQYYYIVDKTTDKNLMVNPFDTQYARYDANVSEEYVAVVDGNETNGEWVTVTFVIHAGSEAKSYRLELWSGERDQYTTEGNNAGGSVIFDYSYTSISDNSLASEYEQEIIRAYQELLIGKVDSFDSSSENISYYEKLAKDNNISTSGIDILNNYTAHYYTFSLYDSANFQPYNAEVAEEGSTGYDYNIADYTESLAYLSVKDKDSNGNNTYTVFVDYSTVDKTISLGTADADDEEETENTDNTNVWLLVSSIVLVVALIFAMLAILVKDMLKKTRRNKAMGKNNYNHKKTARYMRKLHLSKEDIEEVENPINETETQPVEVEETAEQVQDGENPEAENADDNNTDGE